MPNALETPWVTLEVNDVPLSLYNDLGRPNLGMISWSSFLPPLRPSQSEWESLQPILWMHLTLIDIYSLEKLSSGWSPSASPLLGRSHVIGWAGPAGVFELLGGCLIDKWDKRRPCALQLFGGLFLWRIFLVIFGGPKWMVACKKLTNFHWRFPGRKRSPSFRNHPIDLKSLRVSPSVYEGVSGKLVCGTKVATSIRSLFCNAALSAAWSVAWFPHTTSGLPF